MSIASLWGVGQWESTAGREGWEISHEEISRDISAAVATLGELGVATGDRVLFCSMLSEAGQFWPLMVAAMVRGAQLSCVDATEAEAPRLAMFCRALRYRAVLGVTAALVDGLAGIGASPSELFRDVEVTGARPGAYERLAAEGLPVHRFLLVGPAVAIGREPDAAAVATPLEWQVDDDEGYVAITNLQQRATRFIRAKTAIRGRIDGGEIVPTAWRQA